MKIVQNMKLTALLPFLLMALLLGTSCSQRYANRLANHRNTLSQMASSKTATHEQKMDALANSLVTMMHESLDLINPKKSVQYVQDYANQNEASINAIFKDLDGWQNSMNPAEKLSFALNATKKPYTKDLVSLLPRFEKKFKTIAFVGRLTGKLTKGITGLLFKL
jgi:hypothetical protein